MQPPGDKTSQTEESLVFWKKKWTFKNRLPSIEAKCWGYFQFKGKTIKKGVAKKSEPLMAKVDETK